MSTSRRTVAAFAAFVALLAACGDDSTAESSTSDADRTVEIEMRDIAFAPTSLDVDAGETIRFVFTNTGEVVHEAYLDDALGQAEHASEMASMGGMDHGDDDVLVVEPGETGELTHTFGETGTLQFGCHEPGHFEAGMVVDLVAS